jgi:hypothetical protein
MSTQAAPRVRAGQAETRVALGRVKVARQQGLERLCRIVDPLGGTNEIRHRAEAPADDRCE